MRPQVIPADDRTARKPLCFKALKTSLRAVPGSSDEESFGTRARG